MGDVAGPLPENVLIVIADDLGVEQLAAYAEGRDFPNTPTLDALAAEGVLFRNAWTNPICSPSRAAMHTGRYAYRTGLGNVVNPGTYALPTSEITLPEMLDLGTAGAWAHAAFGKWHLGNETVGGIAHPNLSGWSHFAGTMESFCPPFDYETWPQVVDGVETIVSAYATTEEVDRALGWIAGAPEPWLAWVAFSAPHKPFHEPPAALHSVDFASVPPAELDRARYRAAIEALDTELGRLLAGLGTARDRTHVVFVGDNGTPPDVVVPPVVPDKAKNTVFEGGVNVPLIVSGPAVAAPGTEAAGLVVSTDLFATVAELAGVNLATALPPGLELDSVSFAPYLTDPALASLRATVYTESFFPGGKKAPNFFDRALRGERYKLIARDDDLGSLYDLELDPLETNDLLEGSLTPSEESAYQALFSELWGQHGVVAAGTELYGCGTNPAGSFAVLNGAPTPGGFLVFGVDNPAGTQAVGAASLVVLTLDPWPAFPCGLSLPGLGMSGAGSDGELLIDLTTLIAVLSGAPWTGPGSPAPVLLPIPNQSFLLGVTFHAQGILFDATQAFGVAYGLADAARVDIGPAF